MVMGAGATGAADGVPLGVGAPGEVRSNPTTRSRIWSSDVNAPMVETGTFEPSVAIWPDGSVRLLAWRTPTTCWLVMPGGGHLGRVERDEDTLLEATRQVDPGDALDGLELGDDLEPGDLADALEAARAGRGDR